MSKSNVLFLCTGNWARAKWQRPFSENMPEIGLMFIVRDWTRKESIPTPGGS